MCACQGTPYSTRANVCRPGNCRVDADCGPSGSCSPSQSTSGCGGDLDGYFCHTAADECIDDADCVTESGMPQFCAHDKPSGHWKCAPQAMCA